MTVNGLRSYLAGLPWPLGPKATLDLRPLDAAPSGRRRTTAALAVLGLVGSGAAALAVAPPPAHNGGTSGLAKVGPIDPANGFPIWYKDTNGTRVELCLDPDDPYCIMGDLPRPGDPVSFPDNFPDEAFWSVGDSSIDLGGGNTAQLVTAVEAAFASANGLPAPKQQISFGRIRTRIGGLTAGETYTVTHPFGKDVHVAEAAVRGVNVTEDVGSLAYDGVFDQTLASRPGPFLRWPSGAPAGHLGDPAVEHVVTGSPYGTNFFRVEGPVGSFPGSPQQCADPRLGASDTATDDCVETNLFLVQGKLATKMGVQLAKAAYSVVNGSTFLDVWATSEPGQTILVGGPGVPSTVLRGNADGGYFGRIAVSSVPTTFALTNTTDEPDSTVPVTQAEIGDAVHISSALYDADTSTLTVTAASKVSTSVLTLAGFGVPTVTGSGTFTVTGVDSPPVQVTVTSDKGGADSDDVVVDGGGLASAAVDAILTSASNHVLVNTGLLLDGSTSNAPTGSTVEWTATSGGNDVTASVLSGTGLTRTFQAATAGSYNISLKITGVGVGNTDTASLSLTVDAAPAAPTANAGPDQGAVQPLSVVTLDGSASSAGVTYAWSVQSATGVAPSAITLSSLTAARPAFTMPLSTGGSKNTPVAVTLRLVVTRNGTPSAADTVLVTSRPDTLTLTQAQFKAGGNEWRIRGDATYCGAANVVTVTYKATAQSVPVTIGTATPALAAGLCSWDLRLKNAPLAQRPINGAGTISITSRLGGELLNQAFANR